MSDKSNLDYVRVGLIEGPNVFVYNLNESSQMRRYKNSPSMSICRPSVK